MTDEEADFYDPSLPTPGTVRCGGRHYAKAVHDPDGFISWRCTRCGAERVISDGQGWR